MRLALALPLIALLAATYPAHADEYIIMKVAGQDVSSAEVQRFWEGLFPTGQAPAFESVKPDVRDKILRGVMAEKLLLIEAQKQGVDKSEAVQRQLEDMRRKLIVREYLDAKTQSSITEVDVRKEYDTMVASMKDEKEVRARHILLTSEAEAKDARKKIESGQGFEEVAKTLSKDAGSAKNGGDLGYFTRDKMVKEFADEVFAMKKSDISKPIKTGFGWHIIKLEDVRSVTPPPFAEVKDSLKGQLQEKRLHDYITGLIQSAEVKVFDASGKAVAFDKNAPLKPVAAKSAPEPKKEEPQKEPVKPAAKQDAAPTPKALDKPEKKQAVQ